MTGAELKARLTQDPRLTLAVAESITCGGLQVRIGRISGASEFFLGGITAYDRAQKVSHLGVDDAEAKKVNSVSVAVAEQMARGVCVLFGSEVGIATTGYAEPNETLGVKVPFAFWAIARRKGQFPNVERSGRVEFAGLDRAAAQDAVADAVWKEFTAMVAGWRPQP